MDSLSSRSVSLRIEMASDGKPGDVPSQGGKLGEGGRDAIDARDAAQSASTSGEADNRKVVADNAHREALRGRKREKETQRGLAPRGLSDHRVVNGWESHHPASEHWAPLRPGWAPENCAGARDTTSTDCPTPSIERKFVMGKDVVEPQHGRVRCHGNLVPGN